MAVIPLSDPPSRIQSEPRTPEINHFGHLPDDILLLVLNKIRDVKTLGRCCVVSRRFHSLVPRVENVVVHVDCVISESESYSLSGIKPLSSIRRLAVCAPILHPFRRKRPRFPVSQPFTTDEDGIIVQGGLKLHYVTQFLNKFEKIRYLHIKLPSRAKPKPRVLSKWRAEFGSTLDNCVIFYASSMTQPRIIYDDDENIWEAFYRNGGMEWAAEWTFRTLKASSKRHNLILPIISNHKTLESLVLTDSEGQGVICMDKEQLEELRMNLLSPPLASKRTHEHDMKISIFYDPTLELPDGTVYKGATLLVIRSNESKKEMSDISWITSAFEEPYKTAATMLFMRKICCVERDSSVNSLLM